MTKEKPKEKQNEISEQTAAKIKAFNDAVNPEKWLMPGDIVEWYFIPDDFEEFTDEKFHTKRVRFTCHDPVEDHNFNWKASMGAARQVAAYFAQSKFFLRIERVGEGTDTRYKVSPVGEHIDEEVEQ